LGGPVNLYETTQNETILIEETNYLQVIAILLGQIACATINYGNTSNTSELDERTGGASGIPGIPGVDDDAAPDNSQ
jgi:hypothetical protein